MTAKGRNQLMGYGFLAPYMVFFVVFVALPVVMSAWMSVVRLDLMDAAHSQVVGAQNYIDAWKDEYFWKAAGATSRYTLLIVPSVIILGTAMAVGMQAMSRGRDMVRALVYLPSMLNVAATGILWQWFFNTSLAFSTS